MNICFIVIAIVKAKPTSERDGRLERNVLQWRQRMGKASIGHQPIRRRDDLVETAGSR